MLRRHVATATFLDELVLLDQLREFELVSLDHLANVLLSLKKLLVSVSSDSFHQTLLLENMQLLELLHRLFGFYLDVFLMPLLFNDVEGISFAPAFVSLDVFPYGEVSLLLCSQGAVLLAEYKLMILVQYLVATTVELRLVSSLQFPNLFHSQTFFFDEIGFPFRLKILAVLGLLGLELLKLFFVCAMQDLDLTKELNLSQLSDLSTSALGVYIVLIALHFLVVFTQNPNEFGDFEVG